jgi:hypothetical protein
MKLSKTQLKKIIQEEQRKLIREANMDGTISDDEDFLEDQLLEYVEIQIDEIIQFIQLESKKIGGDFRGPGIKARAMSLLKSKIGKLRG